MTSPLNGSEAGGDLAFAEWRNYLIYTTKTVQYLSKQRHLYPRRHLKAKSLKNGLIHAHNELVPGNR